MRWWASCGALYLSILCATGCGGGDPPAHAGCNVDDDCAMGQYCGGGGCRADCREARDCLSMGASAACDARGRCTVAMDAGTDGGGGSGSCARVCDDGLFCNGTEYCEPASPDADSAGCVSSPSSCTLADCDEATDRCDPCRDADEDGDGFDDVRCPGGRDCDDTNPSIPSRMGEVCDAIGVDEDCNPNTVASAILGEDQDGDGHFPDTCCNGTGDARRCGDDCSDDPTLDPNASIRHRALPEVCDEVDNDCDGMVDEGQTVIVYRDGDGDGYGIAIPEPVRERDGTLPPEVAAYAQLGCIMRVPAGWSLLHNDCNDTSPSVRPFGPEDCATTYDDNCNGTTRDGCECVGSETLSCGGHALPAPGSPPGALGPYVGNVGECRAVTVTCTGGRFPACLGVDARDESCNGRDDDCDGTADEGVVAVCGSRSWCVLTESRPPETSCNYADDNCDGVADEGVTRSCDQTWDWSAGHFNPGGAWEVSGSAQILPYAGTYYVDLLPTTAPDVGGAYLRDTIQVPSAFQIDANIWIGRAGSPEGDGVALVIGSSGGNGPGGGNLGIPMSIEGYSFEVDYYNAEVRIQRRYADGRVVRVASAPLSRRLFGDIRVRVNKIIGGVIVFQFGLYGADDCAFALGCSTASGGDPDWSALVTSHREFHWGITASEGGARLAANINSYRIQRFSGDIFTGLGNCDFSYCP